MTQQQTQSQSSRTRTPDATSPHDGQNGKDRDANRPDHAADSSGPGEMEQPHFSEAQSTMAAFAPVERPGDSFAEPEDPVGGTMSHAPTEQPPSAAAPGAGGAEFATSAGTLRQGMQVVDSYGHTIGVVAGVDGERMRLSSTDPHDDGTAFLPVGLIDGIDGNRVLLSGRGDASFGMSAE